MLRFKSEIDKHEFQESVQKGHGRAHMRGAYHSWELGREKKERKRKKEHNIERGQHNKGRELS